MFSFGSLLCIVEPTENIKSEAVMNSPQYIMQDQAQNTVQQIMLGPVQDKLLLKPVWLGLILLVAAINLLTLIPNP